MTADRPPVFLLFPGQGQQRPGMVGDLIELPAVRDTLAEADRVLDLPLSTWMREGPADALTRTEHAQPALLTLGVGVARALIDAGVAVAGAAGHSLGEITALAAAQAFDFADAVRLAYLRGCAMRDALPAGQGAMVALLGIDEAHVEEILAAGRRHGVVAAANHNAPGQIVLSGDRAAVAAAAAAARGNGARRVIELAVSAPFHSPRMAGAAEPLRRFLDAVPMRAPAFSVWSNARLAVHADDVAAIRDALVEQLTAPVQWVEQVRRMQPDAPGLEVAPAGVLRGLCKRILPQWPVAEVRDRSEFLAVAA